MPSVVSVKDDMALRTTKIEGVDEVKEPLVDPEKDNGDADGDQQQKKKDVPLQRKDSFESFWVRKDAKYECRFCHTQFFTRIEVEKCFNDHFDESGIEIAKEDIGVRDYFIVK